MNMGKYILTAIYSKASWHFIKFLARGGEN